MHAVFYCDLCELLSCTVVCTTTRVPVVHMPFSTATCVHCSVACCFYDCSWTISERCALLHWCSWALLCCKLCTLQFMKYCVALFARSQQYCFSRAAYELGVQVTVVKRVQLSAGQARIHNTSPIRQARISACTTSLRLVRLFLVTYGNCTRNKRSRQNLQELRY